MGQICLDSKDLILPRVYHYIALRTTFKMQYKRKQFTGQLIQELEKMTEGILALLMLVGLNCMMFKCGVTTYCKVKPNATKDGMLSDMYATALTG